MVHKFSGEPMEHLKAIRESLNKIQVPFCSLLSVIPCEEQQLTRKIWPHHQQKEVFNPCYSLASNPVFLRVNCVLGIIEQESNDCLILQISRRNRRVDQLNQRVWHLKQRLSGT